ncbi:MAG TPA: TetR/AcrR family transcriptional regulator [Solirubrobacteraceae bacterium]|nr:TetR/AcrR family transcriptional regulator [Solirubrobacteraceae bacterium]
MPRTKLRTPELKQRLRDAAIEVLTRQGPGGLTTRTVAEAADTSTPAVYELFGDKAGLVREVFFEGFRVLRAGLAATPESGDPVADLRELAVAYRVFINEHPQLARVMFSRPFGDFDPGPAETQAGASVRTLVVGRVQRCIGAGEMDGDATDIAHGLVALIQGLAEAEISRRLGTSRASVDRRWEVAIDAMLAGLRPRRASPASSG